ncbi:ATP-binding protein, partial [Ornithobacterium rhinotracheale]
MHYHDIKEAAAHFNFNLRPKYCDKDQALVKSLCKEYGIHFFTKSVDTKSFKKENKLSTQMDARELRYDCF